ncbi:hypothetical protein Tco_1433430 [Tanacetum coccineum]
MKQIHVIVDGKAMVISESSVRSDLLFNDADGIACLTNDEIFENLALMGYEQLSTKLTFQKVSRELHTEAHIEKIIPSPSTYQRKQRKTQKHRRAKKVTELPQTSVPLDHGADEVTVLGAKKPWGAPAQTRVLALEEAKTAQDRVITRLKLRVKRLKKKRKARTLQPIKRRLFKGKVESSDDDLDEEDASKQGRIDDKTKPMFQDSKFDELDDDVDNVEGETVNTATTGVSAVSAPVTTAGVAISTVEPRTPPTTVATAFIDEDLTIAQTLVKMRSEKAKVKGIAFSDVEETPILNRSTTTLQPLPTIDPKDKGKGVLVEEEPEKPDKVKRRDQIESDAELDQRLHEEELAEIDVGHELAVRLTHEEQEKYTIEERARLLAEFFKRRKKKLAAERAEAIRNKPPTRTQVKNMMITYLKHIGKYTHQQLKHKTFEEIQKLYKREKWIDDFKPIEDDSQQQAESTKKRPRAYSKEESSKKQKLEEDNDAEKEELRDSIDVVPRDDVAIDVESLATKYPIVD